MPSIWHRDETPGYDKGKRDTTFTKWRVLVMERCGTITGLGERDAVTRLHARGPLALGIAYDEGVTAEQLAQDLAQ